MNKNNVIELERRAISADPLTELLKEGARKLLAEAVESEVQELLAKYQDWRTESGHAGVVRNGYLPERELQTGLGPIRVRIPKVRSKTGEAVSFQSGAGAAICAQDSDFRGSHSVVVPQRGIQR